MPRPQRPRRVGSAVGSRGFAPVGVARVKADALWLGLDGLEAIRLADIEGLYQDAAARRMSVSRQTYGRILSRARTVVARSLLERKMLLVENATPDAILESARAGDDCPVHGGPRRYGRVCHCPEGPPCRPGPD